MSDSMEIMAFPLAGDEDFFRQDGMTLRDYFAAKAMTVLMQNQDSTFAEDAQYSYEMADAMLKERLKPTRG